MKIAIIGKGHVGTALSKGLSRCTRRLLLRGAMLDVGSKSLMPHCNRRQNKVFPKKQPPPQTFLWRPVKCHTHMTKKGNSCSKGSSALLVVESTTSMQPEKTTEN
ncbi:MAG: hypothetical protein ACQCN6_09075 [Candidatus Bathyarchaeia archaeon]